MKILVLIDSFKGTITSKRLGEIFKEELKNHDVDSFCIADGGDGFLDSISENVKLYKENTTVSDPLFRKIDSYYLVNNDTAYIELAKASGINLIQANMLNPFITTTYGFGEMINDAINKGYKNIILGIGGSATNDCGSGMLEALGGIFNKSKLTNLCNYKLHDVISYDNTVINSKIKDVNVVVLSDVTNPLLGPLGATYVFSRQKGAKEEDLETLENNIKNFSSLNEKYINHPGSGAAGGVGYATITYLNAKIVSGIDYILDLIDYDNIINDYDLIITGEGKIDSQSLDGKVISSILKRSKDKKVILVCAINELKSKIDNVYSVCDGKITPKMSLENPEKYLRLMIKNKLKDLV